MQMSLEETQLNQLVQENEFVGLLYERVNKLITSEGLTFEVFW